MARAAAAGRQARRGREGWAGEAAAIYCRMSHAKDDDQVGVDRQERIAREIAGRLGLVVESRHVFVDNNRSAWRRNRKRRGWDALLAAVGAGQVRHVIAYHPDRLMRQPRDLEELLAVAEEKSVTLHGEANNRDLANPDDVFILRIEVAHACRSSDDTSRRLKSAMVDRAGDGLPHAGQRRYGYTPDGMTIVAEEAEVVREIFAGFLDGQGPEPIAQELNRRQVPTARGKVWTSDTVLSVLDSRHVAGILVFRGRRSGPGRGRRSLMRGCGRRCGTGGRCGWRCTALAGSRGSTCCAG